MEVGGPYLCSLSLHLPSLDLLCGYFLWAIKNELLVFSGQTEMCTSSIVNFLSK